MGFFSQAFLVFLTKECKKRRQKQPGKLMAKSCSQLINLPGAQSLMNPLPGESGCSNKVAISTGGLYAAHHLTFPFPL